VNKDERYNRQTTDADKRPGVAYMNAARDTFEKRYSITFQPFIDEYNQAIDKGMTPRQFAVYLGKKYNLTPCEPNQTDIVSKNRLNLAAGKAAAEPPRNYINTKSPVFSAEAERQKLDANAPRARQAKGLADQYKAHESGSSRNNDRERDRER